MKKQKRQINNGKQVWYRFLSRSKPPTSSHTERQSSLENCIKVSLIVITWAKKGTASIFPAVVKKVIKYLF